MLQGEHFAILLTFIKLPFVIKNGFFVYFGVAVLHGLYCIVNFRILEVHVTGSLPRLYALCFQTRRFSMFPCKFIEEHVTPGVGP